MLFVLVVGIKTFRKKNQSIKKFRIAPMTSFTLLLFVESWSIRIMVFMKPRIAEKSVVILTLVFSIYLSQFCNSHKNEANFN